MGRSLNLSALSLIIAFSSSSVPIFANNFSFCNSKILGNYLIESLISGVPLGVFVSSDFSNIFQSICGFLSPVCLSLIFSVHLGLVSRKFY